MTLDDCRIEHVHGHLTILKIVALEYIASYIKMLINIA